MSAGLQARDTQSSSADIQVVADAPVPDRVNLLLALGVFGAGVALLWLGSRMESWYSILAVGIVFSYLMLTNYAVLHEATHGNLNSRPGLNYLLGLLAGLLFPVPFSVIRITHQGHHLRNRTDFEMFDLYYENDYRVVRYAQWYSILCGLFWPVIPIGTLLFALCPSLIRARIFQGPRSSRHLLGDVGQGCIRQIRLETLLIAGFFAALFWLLELHWQNTLILYACFSFNWSTRQYVGHAFSRRDVIEGAWNLRHYWPMTWILLHGEWDLNHHRRPDLPWYYLPELSPQGEPRPSYVKQYWRQWLGPRPNQEPAPESLQSLPLNVKP